MNVNTCITYVATAQINIQNISSPQDTPLCSSIVPTTTDYFICSRSSQKQNHTVYSNFVSGFFFLLRIMSTILIHVISSFLLLVVSHCLNIPQFRYPSSLDRHSSYFQLLGRKLLWPTLYTYAVFVHFSHTPSIETPGSQRRFQQSDSRWL